MLRISADVPETVEGDSKRLVHIILNVLGNAVKFTKDGTVTVTVNSEKLKEPKVEKGPFPELKMVPSDKHVYIRVQVNFSPLVLGVLCCFEGYYNRKLKKKRVFLSPVRGGFSFWF